LKVLLAGAAGAGAGAGAAAFLPKVFLAGAAGAGAGAGAAAFFLPKLKAMFRFEALTLLTGATKAAMVAYPYKLYTSNLSSDFNYRRLFLEKMELQKKKAGNSPGRKEGSRRESFSVC
jgi:hypothetical protein